jgi:hypothetical protein
LNKGLAGIPSLKEFTSHSPFIMKLLEDVLYQNEKRKNKKTQNSGKRKSSTEEEQNKFLA